MAAIERAGASSISASLVGAWKGSGCRSMCRRSAGFGRAAGGGAGIRVNGLEASFKGAGSENLKQGAFKVVQVNRERRPLRINSFIVQHSVRIDRPVKTVLDNIIDLSTYPAQDPTIAEVKLFTEDLSPTSCGVTYQLKGIVRPLYPIITDIKVEGYVYIKLLQYDPEGSTTGGIPTVVRELKTVQGTGTETWKLYDVDGATSVEYLYNSSGFPEVPEAETTWEQQLFANLNIFKYFDGVVGIFAKQLVVQSLNARKTLLEKDISFA